MRGWFERKYPKAADDSDAVYRAAIRAKALDTVRGMLPAATESNVGIYGTGQAYEALILRMRAHPLAEVRETAVFGVDHPTFGQEVKAVVVLVEGSELTPSALQEFCAEALASYKVPAHIEIWVEDLPRNASGKIMKHVIAGEAENTFEEE